MDEDHLTPFVLGGDGVDSGDKGHRVWRASFCAYDRRIELLRKALEVPATACREAGRQVEWAEGLVDAGCGPSPCDVGLVAAWLEDYLIDADVPGARQGTWIVIVPVPFRAL